MKFISFINRSIIVLMAAIGSAGCASPQYKNPHIIIKTSYGTIEAELYPDKAPKSVAAFLRYVDSGYYENTSFYRVLNDENQATGVAHSQLIQGGLFGTNDALSDKLPPIPHETTQQTGLHHEAGTLSLARQEPGTAGTEFFICVDDEPGFDFAGGNNDDGQGYAAFGKVVEGMDVVNKIHGLPTNEEMFRKQVVILEIKRP